MLALNNHLFLLINAPAGASPVTITVAKVIASEVIFAVPLLLIALWIWGDPNRRAGLASTGIAAVLALCANVLVGLIWYEPRPFVSGIGRTLIAHAPDNSFPSDHVTFMLTVGFALIATRAAPSWGKVVSVLGLFVAWARIYLGVHYPIDMLASAVIACVFGVAAGFAVAPVARWIMPVANPLYDAALDTLRLSARAFPRRSGRN